MGWSDELLFIFGGLLAGIVNTLSGSGSLFSLGVMALTDIPLVLANIASRPGVFFQNLTGIFVLRRYYRLSYKQIPVKPMLLCCLGAMLGAMAATRISSVNFNYIASVVMVLLLLQNLLPRLMDHSFRKLKLSTGGWVGGLLFFLTGIYGGFIQIGIGILVLTLLIDVLKLPYAQSNAYKLGLILIYTIPTTLYFAFNGLILWKPALLLAAGQIVGAWLAALFIGKNQSAELWAKRVTIFMILATLVKIWGFS